jgi:hypothetical protein
MSGPNGDGWMGSVNAPLTTAGDTRFNIQIIRK